MNNIKLRYPIKLYFKKSFIISAIVFSILLFLGGYYAYDKNIVNDDLFIFGSSILLMFISGFICLCFIVIYFKNKPNITLNSSSIELSLLLRGNKNIAWKQVEQIELKELSYDSTKHWQLIIVPKEESSKKITHPLRPMIHEGMPLNEKEIFAIIEQSFNGERPKYTPIEMKLKNRFDSDLYYFLNIMGIFCLVIAFVFLAFD